MPRVRRIIPFSWWPANWGLSGSRRKRAEAEYYWEGEELDYKLIEIDDPIGASAGSDEYKLARLKLDRRYHKIGEYEYSWGLVQYDPNKDAATKARDLAKLKHQFGKINGEELEYELLDLAHVDHESEDYRRAKLRLDLRFRRISDEEFEHGNLLINYPDQDSEEAVKAMLKHDLKHKKITEKTYDERLLDLKFSDKNTIEYKLALLDIAKKHGELSELAWEKESATVIQQPWFNIVGADQRAGGTGTTLAVELDWNEYFPRFLEAQGWTGMTDDDIVNSWFEEAMRQMVDPELTEDQIDAMEDEDYMPRRGAKRRKGDDGRTEYS